MTDYNIKTKGPILSGSITTTMSKCGNKSCRCDKNKKYLHGPYYRWSGMLNGKRATITLSEDQAKEGKKQIKNYKVFQEEIHKIIEDPLGKAPWNI